MKTVATFQIQYYHFLDENANIVNTLPAFCENSELLLDIYRKIILVRLFDARALARAMTLKNAAANLPQDIWVV